MYTHIKRLYTCVYIAKLYIEWYACIHRHKCSKNMIINIDLDLQLTFFTITETWVWCLEEGLILLSFRVVDPESILWFSFIFGKII